MNITPQYQYVFVFRGGDPASVWFAARELRNHAEVFTADEPAVLALDGRWACGRAARPYREWDLSVLEYQVNHLPTVAGRVDVSATSTPGSANDWISRLSAAARRATQGALHPLDTLRGTESGPDVPDEPGSGLSTGVVLGLVVAAALVIAYVFREPIAGLAKSGAKFMAAKAAKG